MFLTKLKRWTIKGVALVQGISIRRKAMATFSIGFFTLTVILVEYMYMATRDSAVQRLEYMVQMTTTNAYNEITAAFERVDRKEITTEKALDEIRNRIAGPLSEIVLRTRSGGDNEAQFRKMIGLLDAKALNGIDLRSGRVCGKTCLVKRVNSRSPDRALTQILSAAIGFTRIAAMSQTRTNPIIRARL